MSSTQIQASVLHGIKDLRVETRDIPAPAPGELQIRIASTGLCGSDLHYYAHFRNGDIQVREPLALGHESAGVVTATGSGVQGFSVGDKVALEVGLPCERCARCDDGRYNICKDIKFRSSGKSVPHFQGTLQERVNHPAKWCYRLPEAMSLDTGALLEPLGVAVHAFRRSQMRPNTSVLVLGAGAVGLLCAAVAKVKGAGKVVIADIDAGRLEFATANGFADASYEVLRRRGKDIDEDLVIAKETAAEIGKVAGGGEGEFDVTFECTGVPSCVQAGIYSVKAGGRLMLVGMGHPVQTIPLAAAALREVDILGVFRYANTYQESIELVQQAAKAGIDLTKLVTHRFTGLAHAPEAFEMAGRTKDDDGKLVLKVVIDSSNEA